MKHFLKLLLVHIIYFVVMIAITTNFGDNFWQNFGASLIPYFIVCYVELNWIQKGSKLTNFKKFVLCTYWGLVPLSPMIRLILGTFSLLFKEKKGGEPS